ncbi:MAG TPA: carbon-nitrogen hydrolase family protein [Thermoanaerobaculia bacterium]|nr:carbon-nitrogen hydrolase family protein [Thermoanaerobaculia bacterium]
MRPFSIAAVQMFVTVGDNVDVMCRRLAYVASVFRWVDMVIFPELAPFGPGLQQAQSLPGPVEERFREEASRYHVWLIPGSMVERRDGRLYNTTSVIAPDGTVVARYSKMFPFLPYESGITAGERFVTFDVPAVGRFGVSICYDMWIPETIRTLVAMGAEVILHPSMTPTVDRDIELALSRSSAAVNQCYVFDVNGVGAGGVGRSIIVGPDGEVVHQAGAGPEIIPLEIDLDRVTRSRERGVLGLGQPLKSFRDRHVEFDVYRPGRRSPALDSLGPLLRPGGPPRRGPDVMAGGADQASSSSVADRRPDRH